MKKLFLAAMAVLMLTVSAFAFSDVPESHWAYDAVNAVSEQGLVKGYPDGTFQPSETLTRAEFLTMCVRVAYGEQTAEDGETWWQPYYDAAVSAKWDLPFTEETITGFIPRFEISSLLRAASAEANQYGKYPAKVGEFAFTDGQQMYDRIDSGGVFSQKNWSRYYDTEWAVKRGLITGYPDGSFKPDNTLTRAEAAAVLYRLTVQNEVGEKYGKIVSMTDSYIIYSVPTKEQMTIISETLPQRTELSCYTAPRQGRAAENFSDWLTANDSDDILNANGKYFWGESGFFEYSADGTFKQLTDMPVIDYGYDASNQSFVFVSHAPGDLQFITTGGIYKPAGDMVLRLTAEGELKTLLTKESLRQLPAAPDGTPYVSLTKVHYATNGKVRVIGEYNWGMADLHRFVLEIKDGAASYVPMGAGNGYSY